MPSIELCDTQIDDGEWRPTLLIQLSEFDMIRLNGMESFDTLVQLKFNKGMVVMTLPITLSGPNSNIIEVK